MRLRHAFAAALIVFTVMAGVVAAAPAQAAEFSLRPDLTPRFLDLQRLFPARSRTSTAGLRPSEDRSFGVPGVLGPGGGSSPPPVVVLLEGVIENGDAERFKTFVEGLRDDNYYFVLAFDSPGGEFGEAFRLLDALLAEHVNQDPRLESVVVLDGQRCLSACAVVFAGIYDNFAPGADIRFLERGAELGFHMPSFKDDVIENEAQVTQILRLGYEVAGSFVRLLEDSANPPELLIETLKHQSADSFFMLTGDTAAWRLGFSPVAPSTAVVPIDIAGLDTETVGALCDHQLSNGGLFVLGGEEEFCGFDLRNDWSMSGWDGEPSGSVPLLSEFIPSGGGDLRASCEGFICHAKVSPERTVGIAIWRGTDYCPHHDGVGVISYPARMCASPPAGAHRVTNHALAAALGCVDGTVDQPFRHRRKRGEDYAAKRDVNVRQRPSLDAPVVGRLAKNDIVRLTSACEVTKDAQGVWFEIVRPNSGRAWVSARFLSLV